MPFTEVLTTTMPSGIWVNVTLPTGSPAAFLNSPFACGGGAPCARALPLLNARSSSTRRDAVLFIPSSSHCDPRARRQRPLPPNSFSLSSARYIYIHYFDRERWVRFWSNSDASSELNLAYRERYRRHDCTGEYGILRNQATKR